VPVHIFRLAGIYGPGRSQIDNVRAGVVHRVRKSGHVFSRIHVADVAGILQASMMQPRPGAIYNVCDDEVAPPPLVPFEQAELSFIARSFYADNKRVRNNLVKSEFEYTLKYPTYREGLKALAEQSEET
jgi:nucleoside-diphosphate-sugar epimerase